MKRSLNLLSAGVLMSALCVGFVACNDEPSNPESGLGAEIPGVEIQQATGTVVGSFCNGFASLLVQVDDEFLIGETIIAPIPPAQWIYTHLPETETGIYLNMIQVQCKLPVEIGNIIAFSFREYNAEKDFEPLFSINGGAGHAFGEQEPDIPICVVTKYEILDN